MYSLIPSDILDNLDNFNIISSNFGEGCPNNILCVNCNTDNFIDDMMLGIKVCKSCGQVKENIIDCSPEWKSYEDDRNNGRCGLPFNKLLPQSSVGTNISGSGKIRILHNWNAMPYRERSLNGVLKKIHDKCQIEHLQKKIEEDAKIMYKIINDCKHNSGKNQGKYIIMRGTNRESIIAASIFFACRRNNVTRSPREIAHLFGLSETDLNKGAKTFIKLNKLENTIDMGTSKIDHFIKRKCDTLGIISAYTDIAIKISQNLDKINAISNHTPYSLAAASILLMLNIVGIKNITKKKLAIIFNVSDVTIIKTYKKIELYKNILLDDYLINNILKYKNEYIKFATTPLPILFRMYKFSVNIPQPVNLDDKNMIFKNLISELRNVKFHDKDSFYKIKLLYYRIETFLFI